MVKTFIAKLSLKQASEHTLTVSNVHVETVVELTAQVFPCSLDNRNPRCDFPNTLGNSMQDQGCIGEQITLQVAIRWEWAPNVHIVQGAAKLEA